MTLGTYRSRNWLRLVATRAFLSAGLACLLLLIPAATRADSTQTYNVTGTLADGDTVNGTITIDFTTGVVTTGPGGITVDGTTFTCPGAGGCTIAGSFTGTEAVGLYDSSTVNLVLDWNDLTGSLPPSSISINGGYSYCTDCGGTTTRSFFSTATLTAVQTPEPPEALLLIAGLGALGLFFVLRRKSTASA